MPLYMDFHKIENVTVDDVKSAHTADVSIQEKYGVRYHQYWVNQKEGTVFCLVEGPDAKTCELVHQLAHGNLACAMTEVEPGSFKLFMGDTFKVDHGLTQSENGKIDDGYRLVLIVSIRGIPPKSNPGDSYGLHIPRLAMEKVAESIRAYRGRTKNSDADDRIIGVFSEAGDAIKCAEKIQDELRRAKKPQVIFKLGISADQPVTGDGEFFTKAIRMGQRLCTAANDNHTLVSALASKLINAPKSSRQTRFLDKTEEEFVLDFFDITDRKLAEESFNVASLCREIGISRPQLYRKMTSLTGRAPNDFLRDLRLEQALVLLRERTKKISQVALEVGYSNPSYFAKCFAENTDACLQKCLLQPNKKNALA